ncbi:MAG: family 20 glycosylhydrolase, partial [Planctomycetota bacterium]
MSTYAGGNGSGDDVAAAPGGLARGTRRRAARRPLEVPVAVVLGLAFVCCRSGARAAGVLRPKFIPTPKSVTMDEGTMPLAAGSRIIATDPSLAPLAAVLSDEIWLLTDLKLAPGKGEARPGDIVLRIDPGIRAGADILAVQREAEAEDPDAGMRAWTKKSARPFEARFVKLQGDKVYLKKADGATTTAELRWLGDEDRAIAKRLAAAGPKEKKPFKVVRTRDFAHTITISDTAVVAGWDYRAVCEGTATILQAVAGKEGKYFLPRMRIKDWPHADFTGCMVDLARQWIPIDALKFTVEACRFWKVRYVHLHFSDNHAYTFPSKAFPELGNRNSASSGGIVPRVYDLEELKELVTYADARGVTLVPELETPGHYGAMARSRGDLFAGPGCMPIASERLYGALDKIVGEMCDVFRSSPYFHIGCDECNWRGVGNSPQEKEYMSKHRLPRDTHPLNDAWQVYVYHAIRMARIVRKYGKIAIAWEGVADDGRAKDEGLIVMAWYNGSHCA